MNKKHIIFFASCVLVFVGAVFYNYFVAQKKIKDTKESPLTITLQTFPEIVSAGNSGTFIWNIDGSPDLKTTRTTIYWGFQASPSALTKEDSPEAVGYPYSQEDYQNGNFSLPDTFDQSIIFENPRKVYFRAYAKVGKDHLWTEERSLIINK